MKCLLPFFILIALLLVACGPVMPVSPAMPTVTSTSTATRQPTLTATIVKTSTPSPSPTMMPTVPIPVLWPDTQLPAPENYHLYDWKPENAEALIRLMENYPETLSNIERGYHENNYFEAFYYATLAGREALLRFPNHPRGKNWRWLLAEDLMTSSEFANYGEPSHYFAELVLRSLNSGEVTIGELPAWASANLPDSSTTLIRLEPIQGFTGSFVLRVNSLALWLLETPTRFEVYPLMDDFYYYFRNIETKDLTGDGYPEIIVLMTREINFANLTAIRIFDVSHVPFRPLDFGSRRSQEIRGSFEQLIIQTDENQAFIQIQEGYVFGCPVYRMERYGWNGFYFDLAEVHFEFDPNRGSDVRLCNQLSPGNYFLAANPSEMIAIYEALQPYWPTTDHYYFLEPEPYPKDEFRFRLGILYALNGDRTRAFEYLTDLIDNPTSVQSTWVAPAKRFLVNYETPEQIYPACVTTPLCEAGYVIKKGVGQVAAADFLSTIEKLKTLGITVKSSGLFDFNNDDSPEVWFTVRHPNRDEIEFWVVVQAPQGLIAKYVQNVTTVSPKIQLIANSGLEAFFQVDSGKLFRLQLSSDGPVLSEYEVAEEIPADALARHSFDRLQAMLYAGAPPADVLSGLLALKNVQGFQCNMNDDNVRFGGWHSANYCPEFSYLLGLTYELSNDTDEAVRTYWQVWKDYPDSPFAQMARFKLKPNQ